MELTGFRKSDVFEKKYNRLSKERQQRTDAAMKKVSIAFQSAASPADMPQSLNKPSNSKPFRRAEIDGDLRLYWWIDNKILVFHDICDHTQASDYSDTHK